MNQPTKPNCPQCNKTMDTIVPKSRPEKGEFFCYDCRKSIRMDKPGEGSYWSEG